MPAKFLQIRPAGTVILSIVAFAKLMQAIPLLTVLATMLKSYEYAYLNLRHLRLNLHKQKLKLKKQ